MRSESLNGLGFLFLRVASISMIAFLTYLSNGYKRNLFRFLLVRDSRFVVDGLRGNSGV
jgi:hypothetical protein